MLQMYRVDEDEEGNAFVNEINCEKSQVSQLEEVGFSFTKPELPTEESDEE